MPQSSHHAEQQMQSGRTPASDASAAAGVEPRRGLPRWLKRQVPKGDIRATTSVLRECRLQTVCEQARCPNRMECFSRRTATLLILGEVCTRSCGFCSVPRGRPRPLDADEPRRVAEAAARLGLEHVVITCVTRDDLPDGGAEQFCRTIAAVRARLRATIEVLPSDFGGNFAAVDRLVGAAPEVYNHNTETVPRLFSQVRGPKADYRRMLAMFRHIRRRDPRIRLKTGLMLGLGETVRELLDTLAELRAAGCQMLTLGQYLRPAPHCLPVVRYVPPEEFQWLGRLARQIGFEQVASGPFVRSSYHARQMLAGHKAGQEMLPPGPPSAPPA